MPSVDSTQETSRRPRKSYTVILVILLVIASILFSYQLRTVLNPLLFAFILAYIFNPLINFLENKGANRTLSILSLYIVILGFVFATLYFAVPVLSRQTSDLVQSAFSGEVYVDSNANGRYDPPEKYEDKNRNGMYDVAYFEKTITALEELARRWNLATDDSEGTFIKSLIAGLKSTMKEQTSLLARAGTQFSSFIVTTTFAGIDGFLYIMTFTLLVPIYMFFILKNMNTLWKTMTDNFPAKHRDRLLDSFSKIHHSLSAYFRGQITIGVVKGCALFVALAAIGVNFSLGFALLYAVTCMVPYLGILVGFTTTALYVVLDLGVGTPFLLVVIAFAFLELLDALLLTPVLMGRKLGLHPLEVILSILICDVLFGFFGLLIAIPLAASVKIMIRDYLLPTLREQASSDPDPSSHDTSATK